MCLKLATDCWASAVCLHLGTGYYLGVQCISVLQGEFSRPSSENTDPWNETKNFKPLKLEIPGLELDLSVEGGSPALSSPSLGLLSWFGGFAILGDLDSWDCSGSTFLAASKKLLDMGPPSCLNPCCSLCLVHTLPLSFVWEVASPSIQRGSQGSLSEQDLFMCSFYPQHL